MAGSKNKYKKILLKLSGEALAGGQGFGIDATSSKRPPGKLKKYIALGARFGIVIGGGNIFRGVAASARGMDRIQADYLGMLATLFNAVAIKEALKTKKFRPRFIGLTGSSPNQAYVPQSAKAMMEKGTVLLLAAGTGNPFFTTDTAAALRASELGRK